MRALTIIHHTRRLIYGRITQETNLIFPSIFIYDNNSFYISHEKHTSHIFNVCFIHVCLLTISEG